MNIYKLLQIGEFHTNYCEDFLVEEPLGNQLILLAVLDGCSMGCKSVFASILFGKILRKIAKERFYQDFRNPPNKDLKCHLKEITRQLMAESRLLKNQLNLEINELLSTLILAVVDKENFNAEIIIIGDGLICIDGKVYEYEQNNRPDYLGYHLAENSDSWYESQKQRLSITNFQDLSISTDGIFTFYNHKKGSKQPNEKEIIQYILIDNEWSESENALERKIRELKKSRNLVANDDLAIIRIIR